MYIPPAALPPQSSWGGSGVSSPILVVALRDSMVPREPQKPPCTPGWVPGKTVGFLRLEEGGVSWGKALCLAGRQCCSRHGGLWAHRSLLMGKTSAACPPLQLLGTLVFLSRARGTWWGFQAGPQQHGHPRLLLWGWSRNVSTTSTPGLNNSHCGKLHSKTGGGRRGGGEQLQ